MNSLLEGKLGDLLRLRYQVKAEDIGTVLEKLREIAEARGFSLDTPYRHVNLGGGPEARVGSALVDQALLGGGAETSEYAIKAQLAEWTRSRRRKGAF